MQHTFLGVFMMIQSFKTYFQQRSIYSSCQLVEFKRIRIWILFQGYILTLDLAFDSKPLRTVCENEKEAIRELGPLVARVLKHRLADLRAAISINDLILGHPRLLLDDGKYHQSMIIDLCDDYQMTFCANHPCNPVVENGNIDWSKVSRVKLLRIERNYV